MDLRRVEVSEGLWSKGDLGIIGLGLGLEAGKASKVNDYATPNRPHCCVTLQEQTAPRSQWLMARVYFPLMLLAWAVEGLFHTVPQTSDSCAFPQLCHLDGACGLLGF